MGNMLIKQGKEMGMPTNENTIITGSTRAELETAIAAIPLDKLVHSVLLVNNSELLTFYDWTSSQTRWMRFNYDTSTNALYHTVMVNSSVDGITTGTKTASAYNTSSTAITSWTLYL